MKDFGRRNVAGFAGLNQIPQKIAAKEYFETVSCIKNFIKYIQRRIDKEQAHLDDNKELVERSFYTDGYFNGRISAMEDCLDILIECVNKK